MINEKVNIKVINLLKQEIVENIETYLHFKKDHIIYRINVKAQDKTEDGINDDVEYIIDQTVFLLKDKIAMVSKEFVSKDKVWLFKIESLGNMFDIRIYFRTEGKCNELYEKALEYVLTNNTGLIGTKI